MGKVRLRLGQISRAEAVFLGQVKSGQVVCADAASWVSLRITTNMELLRTTTY